MRRAGLVALIAVGCGVADAANTDHLTLIVAGRRDYRAATVERGVPRSFESAHPGVTVEQQYADGPVPGEAPDVVTIDADDVPTMAQTGTWLDLAPLLPRLGVYPGAHYDSTVLAAFRRGRAIYALPRGVAPIVLAFNRELFDRAGLPYPTQDWTWDDFLSAAQLLTRDVDGDGHIDQWGMALERAPRLWIPWLWSGGGDVLCPDGRRASGCLDSPSSIAALRWYARWVTQPQALSPSADPHRSGPDNAQLFFAGKVAMLTVSHDWVPAARQYVAARGLRVGLVALPHAAGVAPQTAIYATGFAVPAVAPHRRLSVELAVYLADSQAQTLRAADGLELPAVPDAAQSVAAADVLGWESVFLSASRHGRTPWSARVARWRDVDAALSQLMDELTQGRIDAAVAAHATALRLDQLMAAR